MGISISMAPCVEEPWRAGLLQAQPQPECANVSLMLPSHGLACHELSLPCGRNGNSDAKVMASHFEAELVGIANAFALCEELPGGVEEDRPTVVWLEADQGGAPELKFKSFGSAP
jgi:hypothetical protein